LLPAFQNKEWSVRSSYAYADDIGDCADAAIRFSKAKLPAPVPRNQSRFRINGHSFRNARIGSIADARRAGIIAAAKAAIVSIPIAVPRTMGS
jgi:hypothetical protein